MPTPTSVAFAVRDAPIPIPASTAAMKRCFIVSPRKSSNKLLRRHAGVSTANCYKKSLVSFLLKATHRLGPREPPYAMLTEQGQISVIAVQTRWQKAGIVPKRKDALTMKTGPLDVRLTDDYVCFEWTTFAAAARFASAVCAWQGGRGGGAAAAVCT